MIKLFAWNCVWVLGVKRDPKTLQYSLRFTQSKDGARLFREDSKELEIAERAVWDSGHHLDKFQVPIPKWMMEDTR